MLAAQQFSTDETLDLADHFGFQREQRGVHVGRAPQSKDLMFADIWDFAIRQHSHAVAATAGVQERAFDAFRRDLRHSSVVNTPARQARLRVCSPLLELFSV